MNLQEYEIPPSLYNNDIRLLPENYNVSYDLPTLFSEASLC